MPQDPGAMMGGGGGQPPQAQAGAPQAGQQIDMATVLKYFQAAVQGLVASGMPEEQALSQAMQMVAAKFGPEAAQQLQMAATQGGGGQAPNAPGPGSYGPQTGGVAPVGQ
jgi:monoamine oxidase